MRDGDEAGARRRQPQLLAGAAQAGTAVVAHAQLLDDARADEIVDDLADGRLAHAGRLGQLGAAGCLAAEQLFEQRRLIGDAKASEDGHQ